MLLMLRNNLNSQVLDKSLKKMHTQFKIISINNKTFTEKMHCKLFSVIMKTTTNSI